MTEAVARPAWVRLVIPRRASRAGILIRCWFSAAVALGLPPLLVATSGYRWWVVAVVAAAVLEAPWQWLAFRWVDRHRAWPYQW